METAFLLTVPFLLGYLLDLLLGDPAWLPHPVRMIGWLIQELEPVLRVVFPKNNFGERMAGLVLTVLVTMVSALTAGLILALAWLAGYVPWMIAETLICYQLMAARNLHDESYRVSSVLENRVNHGDLSRARQALSLIVGRDTASMGTREIVKATVETVSENTTDGVVAPMLYLAVGGGAFGMLYKSVNTLDSMVGYQNEKYRHFGTASAKLDDVCGFVPARIAALIMILASRILRLDYKNAWRIFKRDRYQHSSPNSAQTESVCAGALGIALGGGAFYGGTFKPKPEIGDDKRQPEAGDIELANKLMLLTSFISVLLFGALRFAFYYFIIV